MLPVKYCVIWQNGFRGDILEIDQPETRIALDGRVCYGSELNEQSL